MNNTMNQRYAIGIDGGGTQTRAVLADETGRALGSGTSGSGNYHNIGAEAVKDNLEECLRQAWDEAGVTRRPADAAFLSLGSVVSHEDREVIRSIVSELNMAPDETVGVDHDLRAALAGGLAGLPGIALIVGTGSSCYGRTDKGQSWRAGGWGPVLDDHGSGYDLGRQAMVAAVRDYDRRGKRTVLRQRVLDELGLEDIQKIMFKVDGEGLARKDVAAMAHLVTTAAAEGDEVAQSIIRQGATQLAKMVATVQEALFSEHDGSVLVAVAGGLTQAGNVIMAPLVDAVSQQAPSCRIVEPDLSTELGSVLLAIEVLCGEVDPSVVAHLKETSKNEKKY